jgi:phosphoribosylpyrophosphate synthetase
VTVVPPSRVRRDPQPLVGVFARVGSVKDLVAPTLDVVRRPGHRAASDDAYSVTGEVDGRRVLLVDDTMTSGAALQSAASVLSGAGATVVAALVIGRVVDVEFSPADKELWDRARKQRFSFERCCLE